MRQPADPVMFFQALAEKPYRYDFYPVMRRIECLYPGLPRIGRALRPQDEAVRLGQEPAVSFAPSALARFGTPPGAAVPRLDVRFFGMLGPNGPLPLHLTEFIRDRAAHHSDPTLVRFLDIFHHRFLALFYRAWAQAQPTVSLDRPREDRFALYAGALCGLGDDSLRRRDAVEDHAKLFFTGLLARHVRNRDGLAALLCGYFRLPVGVEEFSGHWMRLRTEDRSRLGRGAALGQGALLGARVWDYQHKFRLRIGPLSLAQYESFLPGGAALGKLAAWVRQYAGHEYAWDARLTLAREEVPALRLGLGSGPGPGQGGRLGWTCWLGPYRRPEDAADLTLDAERLLAGSGAPAE